MTPRVKSKLFFSTINNIRKITYACSHANGCFKSERAMCFISCYTPHKFTSRHLISSGHGCLEKAMLSYRFRARYAVSFPQSELTKSAVRYVLHLCHISLCLVFSFTFSCTFTKGTNSQNTFPLSIPPIKCKCGILVGFVSQYLWIGFLLKTGVTYYSIAEPCSYSICVSILFLY